MGMTMTQKILAKHAGLESVRAGQLIQAKLDLVLGNDITTPVAINEFESAGFEKVFDKSRIAMVMDHFAPNKDIKSATQCKQCRTFARRFDIDHFYDVGTMGIEHALLPEQGLVAPGEAVIGADSHTCTYGALGAFSTGVGSTDMGAAMAAGGTWFKVPSAIKVNLTGKLRPFVSGKDVILTLIGMIGVDGARYQSIEFSGEGVKNLTIYDRLTICNMAIEAGGKNGIFPVDDVTRAYVEGRVDRPWTAFEADPDAEYERVIDIDLGKVDCTVAWPHLPENAHSAREGSGIAHEFKQIYACEFYYDESGLAAWPKLDVNFTNKTQFVYRINKGILDIARDKELNDSMPDDSKRVPFTNMVYVGDGLSDVPCMKMMRAYGGQAVAVYQKSNRAGVEKLLQDGRVDFIFPADYREGTEFDKTVHNILRKMAVSDALSEKNAEQLRAIGQGDDPDQVMLF